MPSRHIFMIRPSSFSFNAETALSNAFQTNISGPDDSILQVAIKEFDGAVAVLRSKGIMVTVFDDTIMPTKPDAIFPNNWISLHQDGSIILYPMCAPNRRTERRPDVIESLQKEFGVTKIIDLSGYEKENRFLEGTGSIVFDHDNKIAYACLSPRTDKELFFSVSRQINYTPIHFHAHDQRGQEVYHTNVMMCVAKDFAVICLDSITLVEERHAVVDKLQITGHEIINISFEQMNNFAGNMLMLKGSNNQSILVMSQSAADSLTPNQRSRLQTFCEIVSIPIKTIETIGGGSMRCMIAEVFLPPL